MLNKIKKYIPKPLLQAYHFCLANIATIVYGNPSSKMIIIGVTGTNGKTTTSNLIARILESQKTPTGMATTVNFKIGDKEWLNETKMTMLGRFQLQKLLAQMVQAGCKYAVVETSSQGIEQYRHIGINYDYLVFTNLTPEHIEAHGGFENYKKAKGKLFARLNKLPRKKFNGINIDKKIIVNLDDEHADYFLSFAADKKIGYTLNNSHTAQVEAIYSVKDILMSPLSTRFNFEGSDFEVHLSGRHNIYNLSAALSLAFEEKVDLHELEHRVRGLKGVPGRMEFVDAGQDFAVMVDYAYDPKAMEALYQAIELFPRKKLIQVLGGSGGGRDTSRQAVLGEMAGRKADLVIVTTDDPFDDDPAVISERVKNGALSAGKKEGVDLLEISDRALAIKTAISQAAAGDLVLITGKGAEQFIAAKNGTKIKHDDRASAREAINQIKISK